MAREEAIELLRDMNLQFTPTDQWGDYDDPEPYDDNPSATQDCISREAVMSQLQTIADAAHKIYDHRVNDAPDYLARAVIDDAQRCIKLLPSVQPISPSNGSNIVKTAENGGVKTTDGCTDCISRADALAVIERNDYRLQGKGATQAVLEMQIAELPSVQPERTAEWIYTEEHPFIGYPYGSYYCSECMLLSPLEDKFCRHCGARMKGVE